MSRLTLEVTCNVCGRTDATEGDDAVEMMRRIDQAHDLLAPSCEKRYSSPAADLDSSSGGVS